MPSFQRLLRLLPFSKALVLYCYSLTPTLCFLQRLWRPDRVCCAVGESWLTAPIWWRERYRRRWGGRWAAFPFPVNLCCLSYQPSTAGRGLTAGNMNTYLFLCHAHIQMHEHAYLHASTVHFRGLFCDLEKWIYISNTSGKCFHLKSKAVSICSYFWENQPWLLTYSVSENLGCFYLTENFRIFYMWHKAMKVLQMHSLRYTDIFQCTRHEVFLASQRTKGAFTSIFCWNSRSNSYHIVTVLH